MRYILHLRSDAFVDSVFELYHCIAAVYDIFIVSDIDEAGADTLRIFFDVSQNGAAGDFIQISGALVRINNLGSLRKILAKDSLCRIPPERLLLLRRHSSLRPGL